MDRHGSGCGGTAPLPSQLGGGARAPSAPPVPTPMLWHILNLFEPLIVNLQVETFCKSKPCCSNVLRIICIPLSLKQICSALAYDLYYIKYIAITNSHIWLEYYIMSSTPV